VVLARGAKAQPPGGALAQAGMMLATSVMYLRILAIIAVFDAGLARSLAPVMGTLFAIGAVSAALQYRGASRRRMAVVAAAPRNPLEISAAALFALLFVAVSIATEWARTHFGAAGVDTLAAVVGFTDIDPFVLSIAQGGSRAIPMPIAATAILIAIASNNVLKASYAVGFAGWRASRNAAAVLVGLGLAGVVAGIVFRGAF